jgi:sensor c-di-GMP phosphodiesterase-like protein
MDMAHAAKLSVLAEGVETGDVLEFQCSTSCDEAPGYFLAKPLTVEAFDASTSAQPAVYQNQTNLRNVRLVCERGFVLVECFLDSRY